jgi:predicted DCC family thiol-disulfide oxidoreductase YuxK
MKTLTIFYDARCGLCSTVRHWLAQQPSYVRLEFLAYDSPEAARRFPGLRHLRADQEIVAKADTGEVWQGAGAWITCLWALRAFRPLSQRLAAPGMQALARRLVHWISNNRLTLSELMRLRSDAELRTVLDKEEATASCRVRHDLDLLD